MDVVAAVAGVSVIVNNRLVRAGWNGRAVTLDAAPAAVRPGEGSVILNNGNYCNL